MRDIEVYEAVADFTAEDFRYLEAQLHARGLVAMSASLRYICKGLDLSVFAGYASEPQKFIIRECIAATKNRGALAFEGSRSI